MKTKKIYFDMDGTVYDLYSLPDWLPRLEKEVSRTFLDGTMTVDKNDLWLRISELIKQGYTFGIISWLPMNASDEYMETCRREKLQWIEENMPYVSEINIVPYGTIKQKAIQKRASTMILLDDNAEICRAWQTEKQRTAVLVNSSYTVLDALDDIINL